jgi:hypothetical protein
MWVIKSQTRDDYNAMKGQDITNHLHSRSQLFAVYPLKDSASLVIVRPNKLHKENSVQTKEATVFLWSSSHNSTVRHFSATKNTLRRASWYNQA